MQGQTGHTDVGHGQVAYPGVPQPPNRRRFPWFPFAVVAAILLAGALIAAAIFFKGSGGSPAPSAAPASTQPSQATTAAGRAKTCAAWTAAKSDLAQVPKMPSGWTYETPGIDQLITSRATIIVKILNVFANQVAPQPADVAAAANEFIDKQRAEVTKLPAHTLDAADVTAIANATAALNRACGVG